MYQVRVLDAAARGLAQLDRQISQHVVKRIYWLADNLDNIKPVVLSANLDGLYKLRVGDYRVIYEILRKEQTVVIHLIGHRREVYR